MTLTYLLFGLFSIPVMASTFTSNIECKTLPGSQTSCRMYREGLSFLKVNRTPISYYTHNCSYKGCTWVGKGSTYDLKIGINKFKFKVATRTSNSYIRAFHQYDFIFNDLKKFEYVSRRKGSELDSVNFSFSLNLKEIDPNLYEDYEKFKAKSLISENELKRLFYEREMAIENLIHQYEIDLKNQNSEYEDLFHFEKLEDLDVNKLKDKGYSKEYLLGLSSANQYLQDISEKISFRIQQDFDKKKFETTELLQKLRNYGVEVSDLNVASDIEGNQSSPYVQKILAKIENLQLKFEKILVDKGVQTSLLLQLLNEYKYTIKLTKDIYAQSYDISASDKLEIFRALHKTKIFLENHKITSDFWQNGKLVSKTSRVFVDEQILNGSSYFEEVKKEIIKSSKENFNNRLDNSLSNLYRLNAKIKLNELNPKVSSENINFAKNAYKSSVSLLPKAISNKSTDMYDQVDTLSELGEAALDVSTELIPGASRAKSVYAIVSGKNVFGKHLTDMDMTLEVLTLVLGTKYGAKLTSRLLPSSVKKFLTSNVSKLVNKTKVFFGVDDILNSARKSGLTNGTKLKGVMDSFRRFLVDEAGHIDTKSIIDIFEGGAKAGWKMTKKVADDLGNAVTSLRKNKKLPDNYITKQEASRLGWKNKQGNLSEVAPGKMIGGNRYYNKEGKLPVGEYFEADLGYKSGYRGTERIVYSKDGERIFLSNDHFETFTEITK